MISYRTLLSRTYRAEGDTDAGGAPDAPAADAPAADAPAADAPAADAPAADTTSVLTEDPNSADEDKPAVEDKPTDKDDGASDSTFTEFTLPDDMQLDEKTLADVTPLFEELGLDQAQAQKLVDVYAKQIQESSKMQTDTFNQLMNDWREQSKNDGEIGGDKFDENVKIAQSAISKYGTPELKQLLDEHGVGNHPEIIRFMVRVGRTLNEDVPGSSGSSPVIAGDHQSILYPND